SSLPSRLPDSGQGPCGADEDVAGSSIQMFPVTSGSAKEQPVLRCCNRDAARASKVEQGGAAVGGGVDREWIPSWPLRSRIQVLRPKYSGIRHGQTESSRGSARRRGTADEARRATVTSLDSGEGTSCRGHVGGLLRRVRRQRTGGGNGRPPESMTRQGRTD